MKTRNLFAFLLILFSFSCTTKQEITPQQTKKSDKAARKDLSETQYKSPHAIFYKHVGSIKVQGMYVGRPETPSVTVEGIIEQYRVGDIIFSAVTEDGIKHQLTTADFKAVGVLDAFNNSLDAFNNPIETTTDTLQGGMTAYAIHPTMSTVVVYYENNGDNTLQVKETLRGEAELAQAEKGIYAGTYSEQYHYYQRVIQTPVPTDAGIIPTVISSPGYIIRTPYYESDWIELGNEYIYNAKLKEIFVLDFNDCDSYQYTESRCSEVYAIIEENGIHTLRLLRNPEAGSHLLNSDFNTLQIPVRSN